jgi:hypothetical protein
MSLVWYDTNFKRIESYTPIKIIIDQDEFNKWAKNDLEYFKWFCSDITEEGYSHIMDDYKIRGFLKENIYKKIENEKIQMKDGDVIHINFLNYRMNGFIFWVKGKLYHSEEPESMPKRMNYQDSYIPKQILTFTTVEPGYDASYHEPLWLDYDTFAPQFIPENIIQNGEETYIKLEYNNKVYYLKNENCGFDYENKEKTIKSLLNGNYNLFLVKKDGTIICGNFK